MNVVYVGQTLSCRQLVLILLATSILMKYISMFITIFNLTNIEKLEYHQTEILQQ